MSNSWNPLITALILSFIFKKLQIQKLFPYQNINIFLLGKKKILLCSSTICPLIIIWKAFTGFSTNFFNLKLKFKMSKFYLKSESNLRCYYQITWNDKLHLWILYYTKTLSTFLLIWYLALPRNYYTVLECTNVDECRDAQLFLGARALLNP